MRRSAPPARAAAAALSAGLLALASRLQPAAADIPVHCLWNQTLGNWTLYLSANDGDNTLQCPATPGEVRVASTFTVSLQAPDVATAFYPSAPASPVAGFWTLVYDEGYELVVGGQKFWAFFNYTTDAAGNVTSNCGQTFVGWYHDAPAAPGFLPTRWGCYYATQTAGGDGEHVYAGHPGHTHVAAPKPDALAGLPDDLLVQPEHALAAAINAEQSLWTAAAVTPLTGLPFKTVQRMAGQRVHHPYVAPALDEGLRGELRARHAAAAAGLPESWDWRNASGMSFVAPVRDQGDCGSCYAFATTNMLNARSQIATGGASDWYWSPQEVVSCSEYSQGCDGGFGYLVSKFGEDFGIVKDSVVPYASSSGTSPACPANFTGLGPANGVTAYAYVGGFYGGCSADAMMAEIFAHGPVGVSFEVLSDFFAYTGGIYVHTNASSAAAGLGVNPWEVTNHLVMMLGWGSAEVNGTMVPYWICQNSWGPDWGESGYFRIIRGVDECAIESMANRADVVLLNP
jgi:cathepsin C